METIDFTDPTPADIQAEVRWILNTLRMAYSGDPEARKLWDDVYGIFGGPLEGPPEEIAARCAKLLLARSMATGWLIGKLAVQISGHTGSSIADVLDDVEAEIEQIAG